MLENLTKKQKFIFFIILSIMIAIIIYNMYSTLYSNNFNIYSENSNYQIDSLIDSQNIDTSSENFSFPTNESNNIVIYICGAVKNSKVITLKENSRICDAIDAAGGLSSNADLTNINLASILEDGEKIYIPKKGELVEDITNIPLNSSSTSHSSNTFKNNKININTSTQTELETLPGIGPSTALKIIEYKKANGNFSSIEDIKNVPGIGESKYESIKDYIKVK